MKCVVFKIDNKKYCIDINKINGINELLEIIELPNTPSYIEGIMNLRGDIIPIINLHNKLGFCSKEPDDKSRIINVKISDMIIGFLVDEVLQVIDISNSDMSPTPKIIGNDKKYISAISKVNNEISVILEMEELFDESEKNVLFNIV